MEDNKQAGTKDEKPRTKTKEGLAVPEPVSFPDTLPMPSPNERPAPDDEKPKG